MTLWCVRVCVRLQVAKAAVAASRVPTVSLTRMDKADACDMAASTAVEAQDLARVQQEVVGKAALEPCASSGALADSTPKAAATFKPGCTRNHRLHRRGSGGSVRMLLRQ